MKYDSNPDVALQQRIRWEKASKSERDILRPRPPPMPFGPPLVCSNCNEPCPPGWRCRCERNAWKELAVVFAPPVAALGMLVALMVLR